MPRSHLPDTTMDLDTIRNAVASGRRFHCDLDKGVFRLGAKDIITKGSNPLTGLADADTVADLYRRFRHSIPTLRSKSIRSPFSGLPDPALEPRDIIRAEPREEALAVFEAALLSAILDKAITWDNAGTWFMPLPQEPSLILLKQWFNLQK